MIGIVAHTSRSTQAHQLMADVGATYMSIDNGTLGPNANHMRVWNWLAKHSADEWAVVLEDDAVPCDGFTTQLEQALAAAPSPIVSLYLGTGHPVHRQPAIARAIDQAHHTDAAWITGTDVIHAVALAIHTDLVTDMVNTVSTMTGDIDKAIAKWAKQQGHLVSHQHPSTIDHRDQPTVITGRTPRNHERRAWTHGTRQHWNTTAVTM